MRNGLLTLLILFGGLLNAQDIDVLHYQFMLNLTDENDAIAGVANITFVMKTNAKTVSFDLFNVTPKGKGMQASLVTDGRTKASPLSFTHTAGKVQIQVPSIKRNDTCNVSITYRGVPADGLIISKNKYGERTFFGDNWPNRAHHWLPCVDRPDDKASFTFIVSAPAHYRIISNGIKTEEKKAGTRTVTTWKEATPLSTKVMVIGAARFAVKTFADSPENLPISAWVYPQDSAKGFFDYALVPGIVRFFSDYVAPFPFPKLANVESTTIFGGMENASCIFYAENTVTGDRSSEALLAHEIAHQWFGNMASEKSFAHLWLSEGFATYLTHLYFERKYGKEALKERLREDREEVIQFAKKAQGAIVDSTENLMSLLNANSYQKGGWVLHMLRNEVGDPILQKIIQSYYNQYKGSNAETRDFQAVAEKISGKNLQQFFDQWLYQPGIPKLAVQKTKEGNRQKLSIIQLGPVYQLPLTIRITSNDGRSVKETLLLNSHETVSTWSGEASTGVTVSLDPDSNTLFEEVKK